MCKQHIKSDFFRTWLADEGALHVFGIKLGDANPKAVALTGRQNWSMKHLHGFHFLDNLKIWEFNAIPDCHVSTLNGPSKYSSLTFDRKAMINGEHKGASSVSVGDVCSAAQVVN